MDQLELHEASTGQNFIYPQIIASAICPQWSRGFWGPWRSVMPQSQCPEIPSRSGYSPPLSLPSPPWMPQVFWERRKGVFMLEAHSNIIQILLKASRPLLHLWLDFSKPSLHQIQLKHLPKQTVGHTCRVHVSVGLGRAWKPAFITHTQVMLLLPLLGHSLRISDLRISMSLNGFRSGTRVKRYDSLSNNSGFCALDLEIFQ